MHWGTPSMWFFLEKIFFKIFMSDSLVDYFLENIFQGDSPGLDPQKSSICMYTSILIALWIYFILKIRVDPRASICHCRNFLSRSTVIFALCKDVFQSNVYCGPGRSVSMLFFL